MEPTDSVGPRTLEKQTETAVVRDYLQAWHSLSGALEQNRVDLLNADFVGTAKEKISDTIKEQAKLGIQTRYVDKAHDVQLVFYSPEGLSIQLVDTVDYDVQLIDHEKPQITQHVRARYVAVLLRPKCSGRCASSRQSPNDGPVSNSRSHEGRHSG